MSLFDAYDQAKTAILNPWDVYEPVKDMPETVIVTFRKTILDIAKTDYAATLIEPMAAAQLAVRLPIYRIDSRQWGWPAEAKDLAIYRTAMGASMTVAHMEEAIAMGCRNFVFFGSCGVLDREIPAGHLILPTAACRDEGTSYHYIAADREDATGNYSKSQYIEVNTCLETEAILKDLGLPYVKTRVWTTDGLYRETRRNMERRRMEGCGAVDMECSAVMAAAQFRGVKAYYFLYAEDNLDATAWEPRTAGKVPASASEAYLQAAMEIGRRIG
ncbi:MAG: nucleoside phosphorylase [Firmicutes bacterium]|nr:nucleoside phosphorylase [Bacillota bacterium]